MRGRLLTTLVLAGVLLAPAAPASSGSSAPAELPPGRTDDRPGTVGGVGTGVIADALANTQVGGPNGRRDRVVAMRFRAGHTGRLQSIRPYVKWDRSRPGYSAGTGGRLRFTVQTDDGSAQHLPSGDVLGSATFQHPVGRSYFPRLALQPRPRLDAGELYHVVVANTAPRPRRNFASINALWLRRGSQPVLDGDWAFHYRDARWRQRPDHTPILALTYADGTADGVGYMEVWSENAKRIAGPRAVRVVFRVRDRAVEAAQVSVRAARVSGRRAMLVQLRSGGESLAVARVPAARFDGDRATWVSASFDDAVTLTSRVRYALVLRATGRTRYEAYPLADGSVSYRFDPATTFSSGHAEFTTGGRWTRWDQ